MNVAYKMQKEHGKEGISDMAVKIPQMEREELSYIDLMTMLYDDLGDDDCMPEEVKEEACNTLAWLYDLISPYSE